MVHSRKDWFPTPIWDFTVDNYQQLNATLLSEIEEEQQRDRQGMSISNNLGWHSVNTLHQRDRFSGFTQNIHRNVLEVAKELRWDLRQFSLTITTCWANVNGKFSSNFMHHHANSILSGAYYLKVPENSGAIYFADPRPAALMLVPPVEEFNPLTYSKVIYKPRIGSMLLFPSWLMHGVETNMSEESRISIAFNIGMTANT